MIQTLIPSWLRSLFSKSPHAYVPKHPRGRRSRYANPRVVTGERSQLRQAIDTMAKANAERNKSLPASRRLTTSRTRIRKMLAAANRQLGSPEAMARKLMEMAARSARVALPGG